MRSVYFLFTLIISTSFIACAQEKENGESKRTLVVIHGGAGTITREKISDEKEQLIRTKLTEALKQAYKLIKGGGSSTDAVIKAISILEDSPLFNAGKGSVLNANGNVEMDASIMEGNHKNAGAVAGVTKVKNPIMAAQLVMDSSKHVLLMGAGADEFAIKQGLAIEDKDYFITPERLNLHEKIKEKNGTVGAVALDNNGNISAGTSTGGMSNKQYGRVGDSPIIGAGTYAENGVCGVSCTGHGEYFIRNVIAYDIAAIVKYNDLNITEAADEVIQNKLSDQGGTGGVIVLNNEGQHAFSFNTKGMFRGYVNEDGNVKVMIFKDE